MAGPSFPEVGRQFFLSFTQLLSQGLTSSPAQPYKDVAMVYACINAISEDISAVPLLICSGTRKDKKILENHPLQAVLEYPNPMMSGSQLIEATFVLLGLQGEVVYVLERESEREIPKEIWAFPASRFDPEIDKQSGLIAGWTYRNGAITKELPAYKVMFLRYYNPYHDYRGLAPLQAARAGVDQDWLAAQYNLAFFRNDARPGGVLETKDNLMEDEYRRVLEQWKDRHKGAAKAFEIALLEGGLTYKSTGLSQKDMDWLEGRRFNQDEIRMCFKVPKFRLTLDERFDSNAKARISEKVYWKNCLLPKMALHEYGLFKDICRMLAGPEIWVEYDRSTISALQEDRSELMETVKGYCGLGVPFNVANEVLGLGFPAIPGLDVGYLPFNLVPVGTEPTPPTPAPKSALPFTPRLALPSPAPRGLDRRAAWRAYNVLHSAFEKKFQAKIKKFFWEQRKEQLRLLEEKLGAKAITRAIDVNDLLFDLAKSNDKLKKIVWPLWLSIGDEAGKTLFAELGADPATFVLADTGAMAALQDKLIKITQINDYTREAVRETLTEGLGNVETVSQLQDRVRETFNFTESRSLTIARTETGQAAGVARDAAMGELGVEEIEWSTAGDDVVRDSHAALDGDTVKRGEPFKNGLLYPCDPGGDPGEVINCFIDHQIPIFTTEGWKPIGKIRPGDMVLTHKNRFREVMRLSPQPSYKGQVVRLIPKGETKAFTRGLTATPNHKFLMADGSWKQAQHIKPGDRVRVMASFCGYCGEAIPYWRSYCDHSCLSKAITKKQWSNPAHRENMSRKASAQMKREYAAGIRDPKEIVKKARSVCFGKYGPGGFLSINKGRFFAHSALGKSSWGGSVLDRQIVGELNRQGKRFIQQFFIGRRRVDFYIPDEKLFIECDGPCFHGPKHIFGLHLDERKRDFEILSQYPDHKITHIVFENKKPVRQETFDLLTLNHAGTYAQVAVEIMAVRTWNLKRSRRTYNFAVEEDESYMAKGYVVSNCRCVSIPIVAKE